MFETEEDVRDLHAGSSRDLYAMYTRTSADCTDYPSCQADLSYDNEVDKLPFSAEFDAVVTPVYKHAHD